MDGFLDPFLSTTSWTDANLHESSSWDDTAASQINGIFSDGMGTFGRNDPKSNSCIISQDHIITSNPNCEANIDVQLNSSIFVPNLKYDIISEENQLQQDIQDPIPIQDKFENGILERRFSFPGVMDHGVTAGSFGTDHGSIGSNGSEASLYLQSLVDSQSSSTAPQLWQSYPSVSGLVMGQSALQGFGLHGDLENNSGILGKGSTNHELLHFGSFSRSLYENEPLQISHLPSYTSTAGMNITNNIGIPDNHQSSRGDSAIILASNISSDPACPAVANIGSPNNVVKPRARARRGQATDPHSIAERLRREKIAERMKNLQELVPNSNKADKASMLDEIIEYVKFLQLQVKVLSMSRLGAAGAVVPLITDIQSQGTRNLLLTSAVDPELSETQESVAFEQEVVKLMESNVTAAMQFLQTKGLCLMPVALASAISARKSTSAAIHPKKPDGVAPCAISKSSEIVKWDDMQEEQRMPNGCNRAAAKEDVTKKSSGNARNPKSKA